jgi:hypothetical protein
MRNVRHDTLRPRSEFALDRGFLGSRCAAHTAVPWLHSGRQPDTGLYDRCVIAVAHIQVTNVWQVGGNIRGTVQGSAACVIQRSLKGPLTNGTISICFELPAPVFEVGHEYVLFLKENSSPPGATNYIFVDRWLASLPVSEALINAVRGHQKRSGGGGSRTQQSSGPEPTINSQLSTNPPPRRPRASRRLVPKPRQTRPRHDLAAPRDVRKIRPGRPSAERESRPQTL